MTSARTVDAGGMRIGYRRAGAGAPLVLLHGAYSDSRDWARQMGPFGEHFDVVAWDMPGCGESADMPSDYGFDDCVDTLAAFIDALRLQRPHVLGLSLGSMLAISLSNRRPGLARSLLLTSAYAGWGGSLTPEEVRRRIELAERDLHRPIDEVARDFVATLFPPGTDDDVVETQMAMVRESRASTMHRLLTSFAPVDLRPALSSIDVPTLLLYGDADLRSPMHVAAALHAEIPGSELVVLDGVGHCGHLEAPNRWNAAVLRFLGSVP